MKRLRLLSGIVVLYCLLQGVATYFLYVRYAQDTAEQAKLSQQHLIATYQTTLKDFSVLPHHVFEGMLYFQEFIALVHQADSASVETKEHLRKRIFSTLKPIFESHLHPHGFHQLQLYLKNGERFVQLFDPMTYGDNLLHLTPVKSLFETPRVAEGLNGASGDYHYFFPLFLDEAFVGYIEMSLPFEKLIKQTGTLLHNHRQMLVLHNNPAQAEIALDVLLSSMPQLAKASVQAHRQDQKSASILQNRYLLLSLWLHDVDGSPSGELLTLQPHATIATLYKRMVQDAVFIAVLLVLSLVLFALYQKQKYLLSTLLLHDETVEATVQERTHSLEKHNAFMRTLFQTIPLPAFLNNKEGRFLECNTALCELYGRPKEEIIGRLFEDLMGQEVAQEAQKANAYVLKIQHPFAYEQQLEIAGQRRDFVVHKNVLHEQNTIVGVVGIMQEITERKNYQLKLERALEDNHKQKQQLAVDHTIINRYAIYVKLDTVGVITEASEAITHVSGFSKSELVGKGWYNFCQEEKAALEDLRARMQTKSDWEGRLSFERKDGNTYWLYCSLVAQFNAEGVKTGYLVFAKDVSNEVRIKGLIYTDELTQIYNRKKLNETLLTALSVVQRYPEEQSAFILFDIDDFKAVNDIHGHLVGDSILQELSALVKENLRDVDTFARWGGEEFAIIAPKTTLEGALKITEKLRRLISEHHFKKVEHLTCSFGITEIRAGDTHDELLKRADEALYSSKSKGKNRIEFLS